MEVETVETEAVFAREDRYLLSYAAMDDTHREFVDLVNALLTVGDAELSAALAAFAAHLEAHFTEENGWMESTDFPPRDCHIDEHAKVLASVHDVQQQLAEGDVAIVRVLAEALQDWFPGHADYMDSALSTWLLKRSHAGRWFSGATAASRSSRRDSISPPEIECSVVATVRLRLRQSGNDFGLFGLLRRTIFFFNKQQSAQQNACGIAAVGFPLT